MSEKVIINEVHETPVKASFFSILFVAISFLFIIPIFMFIGRKSWFLKRNEEIKVISEGIDARLTSKVEIVQQLMDEAKKEVDFTKDEVNAIKKAKFNTSMTHKYDIDELMNNIIFKSKEELKGNKRLTQREHFMELLKELETIESDLISASEMYNKHVLHFNRLIRRFPTRVAAQAAGVSLRGMWEASVAY